MIEIQGLYNLALCYTPALEPTAELQIKTVCDQEAFAGCKIRIMPDVHAGKGCTIGTTMTIRDKIVPGMVGVDIGCGMETVRPKRRSTLPLSMRLSVKRSPAGRISARTSTRSTVRSTFTGCAALPVFPLSARSAVSVRWAAATIL